jgi:short-subunit dehydrogenase
MKNGNMALSALLIAVAKTCSFYVVLAIFLGYLLPHAFVSMFFKTKNLKKSYNAKWALVTGSSSGIGLAIAKRLASQGLSVVLVSLDDQLLEDAFEDLSSSYPDVEFRKVGVNLGSGEKPGYLDAVATATDDIDVQCCFLNAGYMVTGFFDSHPLDKHMSNLECNTTSAVQITHLFLQRMLAKKLKGCFVYTSSAAAAIPSPYSVLYASTKSFISSFGASLASEVRSEGIDVLVVHPSPVATRFYDKAHKLGALEFFKKMAVGPDELPDVIFSSIGRLVWRDIGPTAIGFRMLMKVLDYNLFATIIAVTARFTDDFKKYGRQKKEN